MSDKPTVTIPLEEYIELRRKAEENLYLATRLGALDQKMIDVEMHLGNIEPRIARLEEGRIR